MTDRKIEIEIDVKDQGAARKIAEVNVALNGTQGAARAAGAGVDKLDVALAEGRATIAGYKDQIEKQALALQHSEQATVSFGSQFKTLLLSFVSAQAIIGAAHTAWRLLKGFLVDSVGAAMEAEAAQKRLTTALVTQGTSTPTVIRQYNDLATTFQRTTKYSDDLINEMQALLIQVGNVMPAQMQGALRAATDLASGLGIDLRTATMLVGKAFEGETGTLTRYGIVIDEMALKTDAAGAVMAGIQRKFGGQAQAELDTYAGKVAQFGNEWNNFQEAAGRLVIPALDSILAHLTPVIKAMGRMIEEGPKAWGVQWTDMLPPFLSGAAALLTTSKDASAAAKDLGKNTHDIQLAAENVTPKFQLEATVLKDLAAAHTSTAKATKTHELAAKDLNITYTRTVALMPALVSDLTALRITGIEAMAPLTDMDAALQALGGRAIGIERLDTEALRFLGTLKQLAPEALHVKTALDWGQQLDALAASFVQLAQIAGDSFGQIGRSIGVAVVMLKTLVHAAQSGDLVTIAAVIIGGLLRIASTSQVVTTGMINDFLRTQGGLQALADRWRAAGLSIEDLNKRIWATGNIRAWKEQTAEALRLLQEVEAANAARRSQIMGAAGGFAQRVTGFAVPHTAATDELKKVIQDLADLKAAAVSATGAELDAINAKIALSNAHFVQITAKIREMGAAGQDEFARLGSFAVMTFGAMVKDGASLVDAFDAIGPSLDTLIQLQKDFGFQSSGTINELLRLREIVTVNKDVMTSISGLTSMMGGLLAAGQVNQQMFATFGQDALGLYNQLISRGVNANQALALMQPTLQMLWQEQQRGKLSVDAATQALIDQAKTEGLVGEDRKAINEQIFDVLLRIEHILGGTGAGTFKAATATASASFDDWANRGFGAGAKAKGAVIDVSGAVSTVTTRLDATPWSDWADDAEAAAQRAQDAMERAGGASPTGVEYFTWRLDESIKRMHSFGDAAEREAKRAEDAFEDAAQEIKQSWWDLMGEPGLEKRMKEAGIFESASRFTRGGAIPDLLRQWLIMMGLLEKFMQWNTMHAGGVVLPFVPRAHHGLAVDDVPIIAQAGEGVLSRRGMAAIGGVSGLTAANSGRAAGSATTIVINIAPKNLMIRDRAAQKELADTVAQELTRRMKLGRKYGAA